jgi:hypothetical protein
MALLLGMAHERMRDPVDEREEIYKFIEEAPPEPQCFSFNDKVGRIPTGPARGWRGRAQKAKSCDLCEGDLWIEGNEGVVRPCTCREKKAAKRAHARLGGGNWWRGTSLSFAAPPLALTPLEVQEAVEKLCGEVKAKRATSGLWLLGGPNSGKSALCAYFAQRLYPSNDAIAQRVGDLVGHLRWLGGAKGEVAAEQRMQKLIETPLLILDDVDRSIRSWPSAAPFALEASCASQDLIRLARILRERHAELRPTVVTSRAKPIDCSARLASVAAPDLVRGLLGTVVGASDPFEDFPAFTAAVLKDAMDSISETASLCSLDSARGVAQAA